MNPADNPYSPGTGRKPTALVGREEQGERKVVFVLVGVGLWRA
jgi:hypothetical protein